MNKSIKKIAIIAAMTPAMAFAQEELPAEETASAEVVAEASAPAEITVADVNAVNEMAKSAPKLKASTLLRDEMKQWKKEHKIQTGVKKNGALYLEGTQVVQENVTSPNFIQARAAAFEQAYLNALSSYVMDKSGVTSFEKASKYFMDGSSNRNDPPKNVADAAERIAQKAQQLTEAKLDEALRDAGVPESEYAKADVVKKRQLFLEQLITTSVDKAIDEASGVSVVTTFEGRDDKGGYEIGVILRGGVETETLADCLRAKQRPVSVRPDKACPVDELLPPEEDIAQEFGVRIVFDEQGVPALLSYGQAGSDYTGDDEEEARDYENLALEMAEGQANDQLTMFINSRINISNTRNSGTSRSRELEFDANGVPTKKSLKEYFSKIMKTTNVSGRDTMIGRSTIFREVVDHPVANGQRVAVCVRMWSFGQLDAMNAIKNRPRGPQVQKKQIEIKSPTGAGARRGRTYDF